MWKQTRETVVPRGSFERLERRNMFGRRGKWNAKQQQADAQAGCIGGQAARLQWTMRDGCTVVDPGPQSLVCMCVTFGMRRCP